MLDSRAGWSIGGDSGPSIVPGHPDQSLVWKAVQYQLPHLKMPPAGKLSAEELAVIERWIRQGAVDPRTDGKTAVRRGIDLERGREWWAFRPVPPRSFSSRLSEQVDRRILKQLQLAGLEPAAPAPTAVLIRRLSFDLTGLPPRSEDVQALADC